MELYFQLKNKALIATLSFQGKSARLKAGNLLLLCFLLPGMVVGLLEGGKHLSFKIKN